MSISYNDALQKAIGYVSKEAKEYQIIERNTVERDYAWFFHTDLTITIETGEIVLRIGGLAGVCIYKDEGLVQALGSSFSFENWIKVLDKENN